MMKSPSSIELQDYWNARAHESLAVFTERLGYKNADFHLEWYDKLQNQFSPLKQHPNHVKRLLQMWPRGHGKTETTTINYVSWLIGKYPDIHINIVTKTASLAEEILTALITRIELDKTYREIFGDLKPADPKKWTNRELIVNRKDISKNPTLKATGLMGPITGGRSDLIVLDDPIDEENIRTYLQKEKTTIWVNKILLPTLYPWGGVIAIGTRWSYDDVYTEFIRKWEHVDIKSAIDKQGKALWPDYFSLEKLEKRKAEIGSIIFNCQYQNDPTSMEGELLKAEWLAPWSTPPPPTCRYYAGVDPSLGENDYFGIATIAYDPATTQSYLVDVWAEHLPFPQIIQHKLPQLHATYKYSKIYMETNFWQKLLLNMPELQGYPIVPVKTVINKEQRFIPMSSHFEAKRVLVNPLLLNRSEFWMEWVQFPRGQHDDALDCVELVTSNVLAHAHKLTAWKFG